MQRWFKGPESLGVPSTVRVTLPGCRIGRLLSLTSTVRDGTLHGDSGSVDVGGSFSDLVASSVLVDAVTLHSVPLQDLILIDVSSKTTCTLEGAITFGADKAFGKRNVSGRCLLVRAGFAMLR